jgi:hypothetical protein
VGLQFVWEGLGKINDCIWHILRTVGINFHNMVSKTNLYIVQYKLSHFSTALFKLHMLRTLRLDIDYDHWVGKDMKTESCYLFAVPTFTWRDGGGSFRPAGYLAEIP